MKKQIIAAMLIGAFAAPALADTGSISSSKHDQEVHDDDDEAHRYVAVQDDGHVPDPGRSSDRDGRNERVQDVG